MRPIAFVLTLLSHLLLTAAVSAQDRFPTFARAGLGGGFGTIDSTYGRIQPSATGGGLQWDVALGVFVTRWLAVHGSAFGSASPRAHPPSCTHDCGPDRRETIWAQTYGGGLTGTPAHGMGRSGLRPFASASTGLAIVSGPLTHGVTGVGVQVIFGLEYVVNAGLCVGLGIQGMFEGKRSLQLASESGFKAGHAGGILTVSFDSR